MADEAILKTVVDRSARFNHMKQALTDADSQLEKWYFDLFDEEAGGHGYRFLKSLQAKTQVAHDVMMDAASKLARERGDNDQVLGTRDTAAQVVYDHGHGTRGFVAHTYGRELLDDMSLVGATPSQPQAVLVFGRQVAEAMRTVDLPAPRHEGIAVDPVAMAAALDARCDDLEAGIAAWDSDQNQDHEAVVRKDEAVAKFDALYRATSDEAKTIFELAGRPDLARRAKGLTLTPAVPKAGDAPAPAAEEDVA